MNKDAFKIADCDDAMSKCYYNKRDKVQALRQAQFFMDFASHTEVDYVKMWAHSRIGMALKLNGDIDQALEHLKSAKKIAVEESPPPWTHFI